MDSVLLSNGILPVNALRISIESIVFAVPFRNFNGSLVFISTRFVLGQNSLRSELLLDADDDSVDILNYASSTLLYDDMFINLAVLSLYDCSSQSTLTHIVLYPGYVSTVIIYEYPPSLYFNEAIFAVNYTPTVSSL